MIPVTAKAVLAGVVTIIFLAVMVSSARPTRSGTALHARRFGFLRRYQDRSFWPALVLGSLAIATLVEAAQVTVSLWLVGAVFGLATAVLARLRLTTALECGLAGVGLAAAAAELVSVFRGGAAAGGPLPWGRTALLLLLITSCFLGGVLLSGVRSALSLRHGLAYFGMIDVAVFLVSPAGAQVYSLDPARFLTYLAVSGVLAFALGFLSVDIVIVLAAAGVAVTGVLLAQGPFLGRVPVALAAAAAALVVQRVAGRASQRVGQS